MNYCGFGKSLIFKPPYWAFQNASCKIHDESYDKGGTKEDRLKADVGFLWRMIQDANLLEKDKKKAVYSAILYFILVRMFGWMTFNRIKAEATWNR